MIMNKINIYLDKQKLLIKNLHLLLILKVFIKS